MTLERNMVFVRESQTIFCPFRKVLENHDLGKCHKIWEKFHIHQIFFCWYAYECDDFFL